MKNPIQICIYLLVVACSILPALSQETDKVYLEEADHFSYPALFIKARINSVYKVNFDVVDLKAVNRKTFHVNGFEGSLVADFTRSNLDSLIFVRDTSNYSIVFDYQPSEKVSNDYIEYTEPGYIKVVHRVDNSTQTNKEHSVVSWKSDLSDTSITISGFVHTRKPVKRPSRILVRCTFTDSICTPKILENNIPFLSGEILQKAREYSLEDFLSGAEKLEDENFKPSNFYLKFKVVRYFGKGNYSRVY